MTERRVEYMRLDALVDAPRNPKRHDVATLRDSVTRFGMGELPLIDERTGRLVAGHGRAKTLRELMALDPEAPPDGVQRAEDGTWLVPVVRGWASRDDAEAEAYLLASNQLTIRGGWYEDDLLAMMRELDDLAGTGFDKATLDALEKQLGGQDATELVVFEAHTDDEMTFEHRCPKCGFEF